MSDREMAGESNRVGSLDARVKLGANWVLTGQAARSMARSGSESADGSAWFGDARFTGRHLQYDASYRDRSPDFRADLGFIPRVDMRQASQSAGYRWRPESGPVTSFGPTARATATWDYQGQLQDWLVDVPFWLELRNSALMASRTESSEVYRGVNLRKHNTTVYASSDPVKWFGITTSLARGESAHYYPLRGLKPGTSRSTEAAVDFTVRPGGRMRFDETWFYTSLEGVFSNHVVRSKVHYQFTRALSLRGILDYSEVSARPGVTTIASEKRVTGDVLLTYLLHPGTAVYLGYTSRSEFWTQRDSRQVFFKLTYRFAL